MNLKQAKRFIEINEGHGKMLNGFYRMPTHVWNELFLAKVYVNLSEKGLMK